jgi:hypothetical protein
MTARRKPTAKSAAKAAGPTAKRRPRRTRPGQIGPSSFDVKLAPAWTLSADTEVGRVRVSLLHQAPTTAAA